jgi:LmbE family N-acetylglucosaminyl deacetylase
MFELNFAKPVEEPLHILALGAHCDDIEIGCGGTLLKLLENRPNISVLWVVFSSDSTRKAEAESSAASFLGDSQTSEIQIKNFRSSYFPHVGADIKDYFADIQRSFAPDMIFTHYRNDLHQDHRTISELTWNTWRNHLILEYEIPKYDGDLGNPNVFVPVSEAVKQQKIEYIRTHFKSQQHRQWFCDETFSGLMRLRGMQCASGKYAEAFYSQKIVLS